jgi:hypothetical protein
MKPTLLVLLSRAAKKRCVAMQGPDYPGRPDAADFLAAFRELLEEEDPQLLEVLEGLRGS